MDKKGPAALYGARMSGCAMWAPILPSVNESKTDDRSHGVAQDSRLRTTPVSMAVSSVQAAKPGTLKGD